MLGLALMASCAQTLTTSGRVSVTAESVCALRAVAAKHPDPKVRNPDYLAEKFVSETFWRTAPYRSDPEGCSEILACAALRPWHRLERAPDAGTRASRPAGHTRSAQLFHGDHLFG